MDPARFTRVDGTTWRVEPSGTMRVPVIIYADENLIQDMDDKVLEQAANVARLPGIVQASYVMPDAHWGYGFGRRRGLRYIVWRAYDADGTFSRRHPSRTEAARRFTVSSDPGRSGQRKRDHAGHG